LLRDTKNSYLGATNSKKLWRGSRHNLMDEYYMPNVVHGMLSVQYCYSMLDLQRVIDTKYKKIVQ
jgi:hypothetical protein